MKTNLEQREPLSSLKWPSREQISTQVKMTIDASQKLSHIARPRRDYFRSTLGSLATERTQESASMNISIHEIAVFSPYHRITVS